MMGLQSMANIWIFLVANFAGGAAPAVLFKVDAPAGSYQTLRQGGAGKKRSRDDILSATSSPVLPEDCFDDSPEPDACSGCHRVDSLDLLRPHRHARRRAGRRQSTGSAERVQGSEVAQRRRDARRPRHRVLGRAAAAAHVLFRRRRRRRVEDRRCRHHVGAGQRRADHVDRIDRIDRRRAVESQSRVGRHRQRRDPLERDHRPRRLQVDRRRQARGSSWA